MFTACGDLLNLLLHETLALREPDLSKRGCPAEVSFWRSLVAEDNSVESGHPDGIRAATNPFYWKSGNCQYMKGIAVSCASLRLRRTTVVPREHCASICKPHTDKASARLVSLLVFLSSACSPSSTRRSALAWSTPKHHQKQRTVVMRTQRCSLFRETHLSWTCLGLAATAWRMCTSRS